MTKFTGFLCVSIILTVLNPVYSQKDATSILRGVYGKLQKTQDYSVQAKIQVEMPFIHMLPVDVQIFYKQKDKFKVVSKGIAIIPRLGFDQLSGIMRNTKLYTSMIQGQEKIESYQTDIVNIIPLTDTLDLIFGKFWIDPKQNIIVKSQLTTKSSGTILTEYSYGSQIMFGLPDKLIFTVDVKKFKMPKNMPGNTDKNNTGNVVKGNGDSQGKIEILLSNYQVNKGIDDSLFKK